MNTQNKYNKLKEELSKTNIYFDEGISYINNLLISQEINSDEAYTYLLELQKNQDYRPKLQEFNWKDLIKVIDESEKRLKRTTKFQFYLALSELPLFIIGLFSAIYFKLFGQDLVTILAASAGVLSTLLIHTFLILRLHQQAATAIDRLVEKKVGIFFLRIASNNLQGKIDVEKFINAGTQMFLGHHVKPAEPLSSEDNPTKIKS